MSNKVFSSMEEFYQANLARLSSPEADYGVWWTEAGKPYPKWRVSYVKATGEIYAHEMTTEGGKVEILGLIPPDDAEIYYHTLDGILAGWADVIWHSGSLAWVRERLKTQRIADNMEDYWKHQASGAESNW